MGDGGGGIPGIPPHGDGGGRALAMSVCERRVFRVRLPRLRARGEGEGALQRVAQILSDRALAISAHTRATSPTFILRPSNPCIIYSTELGGGRS